MPANQTAAPNGLASCVVSGPSLKPPKLAVYGVGGVGKTTFASKAPKPIFACAEEGIGNLEFARFEPRPGDPVLRSWEEINYCVDLLINEEHDYMSFALDTLDFAEPLLWQYTAKRHGKDNIEDFGYGKGYLYAADEARLLLQKLERLRNEKNMAIILLAHSDVKRYEAPDTESYDRYVMRLQYRLSNLIHDWVDTLLFANWKTHVVKDQDEKDKKRQRARGVGRGERVMYTEERPAYKAKNHFSLPHELPLSWDAFVTAMAAKPQEQEQS